jgi:hypothetical protein
VVATVAHGRQALAVAGSIAAVAYLVTMTVSGRMPQSGQLVRFVAAGVMTETPEHIDRVEISAGQRRWTFTRSGTGQWSDARGRPIAASLATHLEDSIKFMHVSPPVRVMQRGEWSEHGLREFGLDPPAYSTTLFREGRPVLLAFFGAPNPQKVLQYMRLQSDERIYLMSRFIGEEWERALREAPR